MVNYHFRVETEGKNIRITQEITQEKSYREDVILIEVSQHAALVKAIGLAADEIYQREKIGK